MSKSSETICQGCSSRKRCADGMGPVEGGPAGGKLVALAAGYFLAPLVAAIAAAVLTDGRPFQVAASAGAFIAVIVAWHRFATCSLLSQQGPKDTGCKPVLPSTEATGCKPVPPADKV